MGYSSRVTPQCNSLAKLLSDSLLSDSSISIQSCSLNQPITTLVSITIETVYRLLKLGVLNDGIELSFRICSATSNPLHLIAVIFRATLKPWLN